MCCWCFVLVSLSSFYDVCKLVFVFVMFFKSYTKLILGSSQINKASVITTDKQTQYTYNCFDFHCVDRLNLWQFVKCVHAPFHVQIIANTAFLQLKKKNHMSNSLQLPYCCCCNGSWCSDFALFLFVLFALF